MIPARFLLFAAATLIVQPIAAYAQSTPAMQLPADQRAYNAARSTADPAQRLAAYQAFVHDYPESKRVAGARERIFETLLEYFPEKTAEIDKMAKEQVKRSGKGLDRLDEESNVSEELAKAGTHGVDLKQAQKWANDALTKLSEADMQKEAAKQQKAYLKQSHAKPPTPQEQKDDLAQTHRYFLEQRAGMETSVAAVDLAEDNLGQAQTMLNDAYAVQPLDEDTNALRGQLALAQHDDAAALDDFERAELCLDTNEEGLAPRWRAKLVDLYKAAHGGSDAGLTATLDAKYAQMYPAAFTPDKQKAPAAGHTALLELFTGSACPPCVGGDLAAEALLTAYPRKNLVILAFDQNIPAPDPLANPDTQARADLYASHSTPNYVLDGQKLDIYGQDRKGAEELYKKLQPMVAKQAALGTAVQLSISATRTADGSINASAKVTTGSQAELAKQVVMPQPAAPAQAAKAVKANEKPAQPTPAAKPAAPAQPDLVANFALVEDDVRYSGQNGIRFHRFVVRSLAKAADSGFPVAASSTETLKTSFNPAAVSAKLSQYLDEFSHHNDRFGPFTYLSTDTTMQPDHLYIAAWVQDAKTHRVLDAAIVPVAGEQAAVGEPEAALNPSREIQHD